MSKDEAQASVPQEPGPPDADELSEKRIASRVVDELIRRLIMSRPADDSEPLLRAPPRKTEDSPAKEPMDEPTLRAQARERLRTLRASRAR